MDVATNLTETVINDTAHRCRKFCYNNPAGFYNVVAGNYSAYVGPNRSPQFGDYWTDLNEPKCMYCHAFCSKCSGYLVSQCQGCIDGYYLSGTTCKKCHANCATCFGALTSQCTRCTKGFFLDVATNTTFPKIGDTANLCRAVCHENAKGFYNVLAGNYSAYVGPNRSPQFGDYWTDLNEPKCMFCHFTCTTCTGYNNG